MKVTPSEIIYWEILPAIRKEIVFSMKDLGFKQKDIASYMEVTPSAVSQYLNNKRGEYSFNEDFKKSILESVKRIVDNDSTPFNETNKLIKKFEKTGGVCKVCNSKNDTSSDCRVCFE